MSKTRDTIERNAVYLYDIQGWAIHNIGVYLERLLSERRGHLQLLHIDDFRRQPKSCELLIVGYSCLADEQEIRSWRKMAEEVVTVVHDPMEISHFYDRFTWLEEPLIYRNFAIFDRVATTSPLVAEALMRYSQLSSVWKVPTIPHDVRDWTDEEESLRSSHSTTDAPIRALSCTSAVARYPLRVLPGRLKKAREYLLDEQGSMSLRQVRSIGILTHRKNISWLDRLENSAAEDRRGEIVYEFRNRHPVYWSRADHRKWMKSGDVYVCTSYMEGGPLPVMEAVLAGMAVITTPVGQIDQWVTNDVNGFICQSYDECEAAIRAYIDDRELLKYHKQASKRHAPNEDSVGSAWLAFLAGVPNADKATNT